MSPNEIEVGKTYHNGKQGPRSYSARKVTEIFDGREGKRILFLQVSGRYKGTTETLSLHSFARWARGEVSQEKG
ncbi:hypothetical protein [Paenibacillus oleatilyticus]|uniref:hypothetical protein n=1 Tax=Paenibacillus oleatilyticus TaxID=2594886 RepID=UPI001C1F6B20|nr:hypothetical protein [Paenibacillus oleatilyticus]MBU7320292.1 hypothetical protein [Paenibacillus oleatilyticus]